MQVYGQEKQPSTTRCEQERDGNAERLVLRLNEKRGIRDSASAFCLADRVEGGLLNRMDSKDHELRTSSSRRDRAVLPWEEQ